MSLKSSVTFNYIMSVLLTFSQILFSLVSLPYISRVLQPSGVGKISFAMSIINNCLIISQLGIPTYGIRECAKYKDNKDELSRIVQELIIINFLACIVTYIFLGIIIKIFVQLYITRKLIWILSINMISAMLGVDWLYRGLEKYSYITLRSLLINGISVILLPFLVRSSNDVGAYAFLAILPGIGLSICNIVNINKIIILKKKQKYCVKRHLKPVFIFWFMSMTITVYTNLDIVMLGFIQDDIAVGYYNTAIKMKTILVKLVATLGTVLLPRASYYLKNNQQIEFIEIGRRAIHIVTIISIPLVLYFIMFSKDCVLLLSGEKYLPSIIPMQILMPTLLFISLTNILGMQILVPMGGEKHVFISVLLGACTDIIINMRLIPICGIIGAAIGTLIAEIVVLIMQIVALKKVIIELFREVEWWKIVVSAIGAGALVYGFKMFQTLIIIRLITSFLVFIGGYCIGIVFLKEKLYVEIKNFFK